MYVRACPAERGNVHDLPRGGCLVLVHSFYFADEGVTSDHPYTVQR
jgi:hypothetical protein